MRYVITPGQFHRVIYNYLNDIKENGAYDEYVDIDANTRILVYEDNGDVNKHGIEVSKEVMIYVWYPEGVNDIGESHNGRGHLFIDDYITSTLGKLLSVRPNTVMDIVADWFTETFGYDVDNVETMSNNENLSLNTGLPIGEGILKEETVEDEPQGCYVPLEDDEKEWEKELGPEDLNEDMSKEKRKRKQRRRNDIMKAYMKKLNDRASRIPSCRRKPNWLGKKRRRKESWLNFRMGLSSGGGSKYT